MTKLDLCNDCEIDMLENNKRPYTIDLGFMGEIQICYDCLIDRCLNECDICGLVTDNTDIHNIENEGLFCDACFNEKNEEID